MEKTLRQIADELHIDKQKVYRYVKRKHIKEAYESDSVMYFDDTAQALIRAHFDALASTSEAHQKSGDDTLLIQYRARIEELEKDKEFLKEQVTSLTQALDQEQKLHAVSEQKLQLLEDKKHRLFRWRKG